MTEEMFGPSNPSQDQWNVKFPPHYPPFAGISCDDEGRTFVKTYEERSDKPGGIYDVFDKQGRFIAKDLVILKNGKIYTIDKMMRVLESSRPTGSIAVIY